MALDAATLALTAAELKTTLADAKIAKLFEPTRDELVITLRTRTETDSLLLSARSGSARVCLTEESFENPETPPSFCMLMRKHLTGGRLLDVRMEPGDRIVYFEFQCTNEMGDLVRNILCTELMGRYSNLVLVQNGKIIDALKRVDFEDSDVRQLLPGLPYTTPPKPARPDFLAVSSASIVAAACERDLPVADALNKTVAGVGPVVCREAAWRAFDGEHLLANELTEAQKVRLMAAIDELKEIYDAGGCPCSVTAPDGKPVEYTFFRPRQYGEKYLIKEWPSFNAMLEGYYAEKDRAERLRTKSKELHKAVHNMYERAVRKQAARQEELAASGKSEKLRLYGELLSANLYLAEKGMKSITVPNWYDEGKEVIVPYLPSAAQLFDGVTFTVPKRGEKLDLLEFSLKSARIYRAEQLKNLEIKNPERHTERLMATMQKELHLDRPPRHIECFDNSNLQGTNPVASCVVFRDGKPSRKEYRHFNIKTVIGADDFASMREIVFRRYSRLIAEGAELPDLIIVDGGKGQLSSAYAVLCELGIEKQVPIVGLAKRIEEIFFPGDPMPYYLSRTGEPLKVVCHIRDEAHRFGITFHRQKRSKAFIHSELENIEGVGPKTIELLLRHFRTVEKIRTAPAEELSALVGPAKAARLLVHFGRQ